MIDIAPAVAVLAIGLPDVIADPIADQRSLEPLYEFLQVSPPYIVDLLVASIVVVASWVVGRWIIQLVGRPIARRFERPSVTRAVLQSIRISILILGILFAATIVGFSPGQIFLSVTVFSAVLAVVLAPIVRRFISGMFVLADRPFEIGDMIELVDTNTRGFVEDVTLRYTKLFTLENTFLVIPNSDIVDRDIINYSAEDQRTRQEVSLLVTYEGDLERARELAVAAAADVDPIIAGGPPIRIGSTRYPAAPQCQIESFADNGVLLRLKYWVLEPYHLDRVASEIRENIWQAIAEEPVEMAYPHAHIVFDETSGTVPVSMNEPLDDRTNEC